MYGWHLAVGSEPIGKVAHYLEGAARHHTIAQSSQDLLPAGGGVRDIGLPELGKGQAAVLHGDVALVGTATFAGVLANLPLKYGFGGGVRLQLQVTSTSKA